MSKTTAIDVDPKRMDETDEINGRFKDLALESATAKPEDFTLSLPEALRDADSALDHGALPHDPEALKQIITDLDHKLRNCQDVAVAEIKRINGAHKSTTNDLNRARMARKNDTTKHTNRAEELNTRWRNEVTAHTKSKNQLQSEITAMEKDNKGLRETIAAIRDGPSVDIQTLDRILASTPPATSSKRNSQGGTSVGQAKRTGKILRQKVHEVHQGAQKLLADAKHAAKRRAIEKADEYLAKLNEKKKKITELKQTIKDLSSDQAPPNTVLSYQPLQNQALLNQPMSQQKSKRSRGDEMDDFWGYESPQVKRARNEANSLKNEKEHHADDNLFKASVIQEVDDIFKEASENLDKLKGDAIGDTDMGMY